MTYWAVMVDGVFENQFEFQPPFPFAYSRSTVRTSESELFHRYRSIFICMNVMSKDSKWSALVILGLSLQYSTNSFSTSLYCCSNVAPILSLPCYHLFRLLSSFHLFNFIFFTNFILHFSSKFFISNNTCISLLLLYNPIQVEN